MGLRESPGVLSGRVVPVATSVTKRACGRFAGSPSPAGR